MAGVIILKGAVMKNDKGNTLLEEKDWKNIVIKLTHYALWRARRYPWKTGCSNHLPGGMTPADIACGAIEKVLSGTRKWDPDKYPDLLKHLQWIVDSDMEHLFSSIMHQKNIRIPQSDDEPTRHLNYET